jgi:serine/threonine protein kinase/Flp pilus assembly protein TadD
MSFLEVRRRKRELLAELSDARSEGPAATAEEVLARWPSDPSADADVASVLFADFCRRRSRGEQPSLHEYQERFPHHQDSLDSLLRSQALLHSLGGVSGSSCHTLKLPEVGDELFGFRLRREVGRGAFARVFLAEQGNLAGRPVVLKVSAAEGDEAQTLAQLQHTHIVPIHSVHDDAAAGLRAVCMPYLGGASLSQVLHRLRDRTPVPQRGQELAEALGEVDIRRHGETAPARALPAPPYASDSFVRASAWIVVRLAEALQHAHERGVLHRDIKPSNILLASDGQPLLLDFNLAQDHHNDGARATVGGTVAYMAPEHLRALASRDPALVRMVDGRSDIYSLGMVLFEMLAGESPFDQSASYCPLPALIEAMAVERSRKRPSLRQKRTDVPWGLESIVGKCLAPDPAERYQRAADLAEDLRRLLGDQPLRFAPELSRTERVRKWLRRHPRLTSSGTVAAAAAVLLVAALGSLVGVLGHLSRAEQELAQAQWDEMERTYEARAQRGLRLVNTREDLRAPAPEGEDAIREALAVYGVLDRDDWQEQPAWQQLEGTRRRRLAEDTRELLLLLAWARTRTAPGEPAVLHDALALLDRAAAVQGLAPSAALALERAAYLEALGDAAGAAEARRQAEQTPPASARDHYLLALAQARAERHAEAIASLDRGLQLDPRHYWSRCLRGLCYQNRGEHALAIADFSFCLGQHAEGWVLLNRGYSLYLLGQRREAVTDFTAALDLEPGLGLAYWNRGTALLELERYEEALADFRRSPATGREALCVLNEGLALEGLGRHDDADGAFAQALDRAATEGPEVRRLVNGRYGIAVSQRRPAAAAAALARVLAEEPDDPFALYGQGALLVTQGEEGRGLACLNRALEVRPDFLEARRLRAVVLARRGQTEAAGRDINFCLVREPEGPVTLYTAACVVALSGRGDDQLLAQALTFLEKAVAQGHGWQKAAQDDDLANLRHLPRFRELVAGRP